MSAQNPPRQRSLPDRLRQVVLFEAGGLLLICPPFVWLSGVPLAESAALMIVLALIAALWNAAFNTGFDWVEGQLTGRTADRRPWRLRAAHAISFELGLLMMTLPVIAWWTGMNWVEALVADVGLALAYMGYAFVFNVAYDRAFPITTGEGR